MWVFHAAKGETSSSATLWVMISPFCPFSSLWVSRNTLITPPVGQTFGSACPAVLNSWYGDVPVSYSLAFPLKHTHMNTHFVSNVKLLGRVCFVERVLEWAKHPEPFSFHSFKNGLGSSLNEMSITASRLLYSQFIFILRQFGSFYFCFSQVSYQSDLRRIY